MARGAQHNLKAKQIKLQQDRTLGNYILCPLQVPTDSQLTVYGGWVGNMDRFLQYIDQLTDDLPSGFYFRIKEHPTSHIPLTDQVTVLESERLRLDNQTDTMDLIQHCRAVLTINSTVGLDAFHFSKPVITLGEAFYSFGDLTSRADNFHTLKTLIKTVETLRFSEENRDLFMRFLYYWYPKTSCITNLSLGHT